MTIELFWPRWSVSAESPLTKKFDQILNNAQGELWLQGATRSGGLPHVGLSVKKPDFVREMVVQVTPSACFARLVVVQQFPDQLQVLKQPSGYFVSLRTKSSRNQGLDDVSGLRHNITICMPNNGPAQVGILRLKLGGEQRLDNGRKISDW
jgi:hypothetical protein